MADSRRVLQAILVKVRPGKEATVREWLHDKAKAPKSERHCHKTGGTSQDCSLCSDEELNNPQKRPGSLVLPCEEMDVVALAYLTGPFDFLLVACVPDCGLVETFLIDCLRSWEIAEHIMDTQTLVGVVYYPPEHEADEAGAAETSTHQRVDPLPTLSSSG